MSKKEVLFFVDKNYYDMKPRIDTAFDKKNFNFYIHHKIFVTFTISLLLYKNKKIYIIIIGVFLEIMSFSGIKISKHSIMTKL